VLPRGPIYPVALTQLVARNGGRDAVTVTKRGFFDIVFRGRGFDNKRISSDLRAHQVFICRHPQNLNFVLR
jgi:hypothetical protein